MDVTRHPLRIAVLIPCYNEEVSIAKTVTGFRAALPTAKVYVYENNSSDQTGLRAREAGAVVRSEMRQGKGNVVRRMFSDVEADVYVMADGDATYDPNTAQEMIECLVRGKLDMVIGKRVHTQPSAYRPGHVFYNRLFSTFLGRLFGQHFTDVLSGYRVFSRRFVKSFPALCTGFETETELSVHALTLGMPTAEIETSYLERETGSTSKLNSYLDGCRILLVMFGLFKDEKPVVFFGLVGAALGLASLLLSVPIFITYLETGLVPRFPTAILSASVMLLAFLSLVCGVVLDTVSRGRREFKRLSYLHNPAPGTGFEYDP